jgi:outer membrane receptor protein involved in Fe transport
MGLERMTDSVSVGRDAGRRLWASVAILTPMLGFAAAHAAETALPPPSDAKDMLEEVVVTAEKRESTVQKTPLSITAISGSDLHARGLSSAQDAVQAVPGIAVTSAGPGQAQYEIRGLSASGGESPTIGFYLGETPITPPATATTGKSAIDPDLYDLARVEVLRGPQGTLYGAGSMGGTVKLVPNPPDPNGFYGSAQTTLSGTRGGGLNYGEKAMLNLPLAADTMALRIVGTYGYTSGWIDRVVSPDFPLATNGGLTRGDVRAAAVAALHHRVNDERLTGARVALLIKPTDAFTVTPSIFYQRITQGGMNTYDSDPGTLTHYQPFDIAEPYTDRFTVYSLPATYTWANFSVTSASSYWTRTSTQAQDGSEAVQNALGIPTFDVAAGGIGPVQAQEVDSTHEFSQEIRVASSGEQRFQWIVGGFYSNYHFSIDTGATHVPGLLTAAGGAFGTSNLFHVMSPLRIKEEAGFLHLSYQFDHAVKLEAGARYYAYQSSVSSVANGFAYGGDTPVLNAASASANGVNPMVNLSWTPEGGPLLYATAAKGFREGAGNFPIPTTGTVGSVCLANLEAIGRSSAPTSFDPDTVWSYELGEKGRFFDGRVIFNADAFYISWAHVQQLVALACGLSFTANGPNAAVKGGEAELQAKLARGLTLTQSVGYADAAFSEAYPAAAIVAGQPLLDAPRWTLSTSLRYEHPLSVYTFIAQAQNSYQSPSYDLSYQLNHLPGRDLTNVRSGLEAEKWSVYAFANNVLNRHYPLENLNLLTFTGPDYNRVATNQPFTAGVEVEVKF